MYTECGRKRKVLVPTDCQVPADPGSGDVKSLVPTVMIAVSFAESCTSDFTPVYLWLNLHKFWIMTQHTEVNLAVSPLDSAISHPMYPSSRFCTQAYC